MATMQFAGGAQAQVMEPEVRTVSPEEIYHDRPEVRFGDLTQALAQGRSMYEAMGGNDRIPPEVVGGDWGQNDNGSREMVQQFMPPQREQPRNERGQFMRPEQQPAYVPQAQTPEGLIPDRRYVDARTTSPMQDYGFTPPAQNPWTAPGAPQPAPTGARPPQGQPISPFEQMLAAQQAQIAQLMQVVTTLTTQQVQRPTQRALTPDEARASLERDLFGRVIPEDQRGEPASREEILSALSRVVLENEQNAQRYAAQASADAFKRANGIDPAVEALVMRNAPWLREISDPMAQAQATVSQARMLGAGGGQGQAWGANGYPVPNPFIPGVTAAGTPFAGGPLPAPTGMPTMRARTFVERGVPNNMEGAPVDPASAVLGRVNRGDHVTTNEMKRALIASGMQAW